MVLTYYDLTEGDADVRSSDSWWVEQFNSVIRRVAEEQDARVADVAEQFAGRIAEFTLYPFDVHPSNAGHLAIARSVWSALAVDTEPPSVEVTSSVEATRSTPTVTFSVRDNVDVSHVAVSGGGVSVYGPFESATDEYAVLLDLGSIELGEVALTIEIGDDAGNVSREVVTLQVDVGSRGESQ